MRAAALAGIDVPKLCATDSPRGVRLLPHVPGRGRGRQGHAGVVHHAVLATAWSCARDTEQVAAAAPRRHGALHLRPPARLPDLLRQRQLRAAGHGRGVGLREVRYGSAGRDHLERRPTDTSNPYFDFDPAKCIVCSRCVRACDEIQGTFALTIEGRGFDSKVAAGAATSFLDSECVSCGACVQACPTDALAEKSLVELGMPTRSVDHDLRLLRCRLLLPGRDAARRRQVVRMVPQQGRRRQRGPLVREGSLRVRLRQPPRPGDAPDGARVDRRTSGARSRGTRRSPAWPRRFREIQAEHGVGSIGGITSSRCTNEEVYVVQKMVRAAFGNNNVDTCARVCHSPTGYGLKQTFGTSAGTQDFKSVDERRRDPGHRRQPDRRPPGVRLADEAAAAPGRPSSSWSTRAGSTSCARRTSRPRTTCSCCPAPTSR